MKTFKEIKVWQKAIDFVTALYLETANYPKEELYGLTSQIRRSAISIPSNIAEGFGRNTGNEFKRYLQISLGSLFEIQTQLNISKNLKFLGNEQFDKLYESTREIERMLVALIKSIK